MHPDKGSRRTPSESVLVELVRAFDDEARVAHALRDLLVAQRAAVAGNDDQAVDSNVEAINRTLLMLAEARTRREGALQVLSDAQDRPLPSLETVLGTPVPPTVAAARSRLEAAAAEVAREVAINRRMLGRVLEAGETFLQKLFAAVASDPGVGYGPKEGSDGNTPNTPFILDRTA